MEADDERLEGRTLRENVVDPKSEEVLFKSGEIIDAKMHEEDCQDWQSGEHCSICIRSIRLSLC